MKTSAAALSRATLGGEGASNVCIAVYNLAYMVTQYNEDGLGQYQCHTPDNRLMTFVYSMHVFQGAFLSFGCGDLI